MQVRRFHVRSERRTGSDTKCIVMIQQEEHSHSMLAPGLGKGCCSAAALLETSISGHRSRCVCFSPRFRFLLDSSFSTPGERQSTTEANEGRTIVQHVLLFQVPRRPATLLITTSIKRAWSLCPASAAHNNTSSPSPPSPTGTRPSQLPKSAAPWNWIVQRS